MPLHALWSEGKYLYVCVLICRDDKNAYMNDYLYFLPPSVI